MSGVPNGTPETDQRSSTVKGKDGKKYPSSKLILCDRCQRVGAAPGCNMCKDARKSAKKPRPKAKQVDAMADNFGNEIPQRRRDIWGDTWLQETLDFFMVFAEQLRDKKLATGMNKRKRHYPFIESADVIDGVRMLDNTLEALVKHLKDMRPAGVCQSCQGEGCPKCKESGLVPRAVYEKAK